MKKISLVVALLITSVTANSENYSDYKSQVCAKVKQCRLGSLLANDMPEPMQDFVVQMVDAQCLTMVNGFEAQIVDAGLQESAKRCVATVKNQSCESLLATKGQANTDECSHFLESADQAGIDFSKIKF